MHLQMRARSDNKLDLEQGEVRTIGHTEQTLDSQERAQKS
jgi:hypothetical protein